MDRPVFQTEPSSYVLPEEYLRLEREAEFNEDKKPGTLLNPTLLVEVLSPTTSQYDRSEKFMLYRQVPSLRQYLTLDAQAIHAELHTLDDLGRWVLTETRDLHAALDLSSIACQVPLAEVYAGVSF